LKIINYINTGKSPFWIAISNNSWINLFINILIFESRNPHSMDKGSSPNPRINLF
jgi:hypothetical protein